MLLRSKLQDYSIRAIATDFDGTLLAKDGTLDELALTMLRALRGALCHTILVTGRPAEELRTFPQLEGCFDAYVLESGSHAVRSLAEAKWVETATWMGPIASHLASKGIAAQTRQASIGVPASHWTSLENDPALAGMGLHRNRDSVDVTDRLVDKRHGLSLALEFWPENERRDLLAFGDAQNDLPMLRHADFSVAVEDAEPEVLGCVQARTGPAGRGVGEFLSSLVDGVDPIIEPRTRNEASQTRKRRIP